MYTIDELKAQAEELRTQARQVVPDGICLHEVSLVCLEADEVMEVILKMGPNEVPAELTHEEYAYSRISRLAGMIKMLHFTQVELPNRYKRTGL